MRRKFESRVVAGGWVLLGLCISGCGAAEAAPESSRNAAPAALARPAPTLADSTLARLVREIQPAVERSARIQAERPLLVAATDEGRLRDYLERQLREQLSPELAAAITATYARLGLVPDTLDLRALMLALLEEQVVGYYDPVTDTLFVHERVGVEQLEPVLAHELVHALQDQRLSLDSLQRALDDRNDRSTASQAALEGHATYAMMEWQFSAMTGSPADLTTLPDLGATLANVDLTALGDFGSAQLLAEAPRIVREGLIFPYVGGLVFLQRVWKERADRPLPFGDHLPLSTEQVLHVDRWLGGDVPTEVRFVHDEVPGWALVHGRDLGELETRIFFEEHLGDRTRAEDAAGGWDGDAYRLWRGPEGEAFVWVSVWDSEADAEAFAAAAREAYMVRYAAGERRPSVERSTRSGRAVVSIRDLPPGVAPPPEMEEIVLSEGA